MSCGLAVWLLSQSDLTFLENAGAAQNYQRTRRATASLTYLLAPAKALHFQIPPQTETMRVVVNGVVRRENLVPEPRFAVAYEWQDRLGTVLGEGVYHFRAGIEPDDAAQNRTLFFEDPRFLPSDPRAAALATPVETERAVALVLRLVAPDPEIDHLVVRCYADEVLRPEEARRQWQRASPAQRRELAKGNVYPASRLTVVEREGLMERRRRPLGPLGIQGRDFSTRMLYAAAGGRFSEVPQQDSVKVATGNLLHPDQALSWAIDGPKSDLTLIAEGRNGEPVTVTATVPGREGPRRRTWDSAQGAQTLRPDAAGLLVVRVSASARVTLNNGDSVLKPAGFQIDHQRMDGEPLVYTFQSEAGAALRLDLRAPQGSEPQWRFEWLDSKGRVLHHGTEQHFHTASPYQWWLLGEEDVQALGETERIYFRLPQGAAALRLTSDLPLLTAAYVQPADWFLIEEKEGVFGQQWFSIQPPDPNARRAVVQVMTEPDAVGEQGGIWQAESMLPRGDWLGHHLWLAREEQPHRAEESLTTVYTHTPVDRSLAIAFKPIDRFQQEVQPALVVFRRTATPTTVTVMLEDQVHFQQRLAARHGDWRLPPLPTGTSRIQIKCDDPAAQFYLSHRMPQGVFKRKRLAAQLNKDGLVYQVHKAGTDTRVLKGWLLTRPGLKQAPRLRISLKGLPQGGRAQREFTTRQRELVLQPAPEGERLAWAANGSALWQWAPFYIPLKSDCPPGDYEVAVTAMDGKTHFLLLNQIWREQETANAQVLP